MAHKRKTVSGRLSRYMGPSPYHFGPGIDWNDPSIWTAAAREAFDPADLERATKIAFSKFHLDPRNPHHWRLLLHFFADAHFGAPKRHPGAPRYWSDKQWCQLVADYYRTKARHPTKSKSGVCQIMKKDQSFKSRYWFDKNVETIRRNVNRGQDRRHNHSAKVAKRVLARTIPIEKESVRKRGGTWTESDEAKAHASAFEALISDIDELSIGYKIRP
jgi:hypothetical protein